jgi:hypothetical protein
MHAINACLGGPVYTWSSFMQLCAKFDGVSGAASGTASTMYLAGNDITLFGYAVKHAGRDWHMLPLAMYSAGTSGNKKTAAELARARAHAIGCFVYNAGHVWYLKRTEDGKWARIDSLSGVSVVQLESVWRDGLGVEVVYPDASTVDTDPIVTPDAPCPFIQTPGSRAEPRSEPTELRPQQIPHRPQEIRSVPQQIVPTPQSFQTRPEQIRAVPQQIRHRPQQIRAHASSLLYNNRGSRSFSANVNALGFANSMHKRY